MSKKILIINGSYRADGITDQTTKIISSYLANQSAEVENILLREAEINFCLNCRECMQKSGEKPEPCVQLDAMEVIVQRIEKADAFVLASPTNLGSVTAIFKRFMERLAVYAYWPWGAPSPKHRKDSVAKKDSKKALLVTSSAAPGIIARWFFSSTRQLKYTAKIIGANPIGIINSGIIAKQRNPNLTVGEIRKIQRQAEKLL